MHNQHHSSGPHPVQHLIGSIFVIALALALFAVIAAFSQPLEPVDFSTVECFTDTCVGCIEDCLE